MRWIFRNRDEGREKDNKDVLPYLLAAGCIAVAVWQLVEIINAL